jgi:hypothetical protein
MEEVCQLRPTLNEWMQDVVHLKRDGIVLNDFKQKHFR